MKIGQHVTDLSGPVDDLPFVQETGRCIQPSSNVSPSTNSITRYCLPFSLKKSPHWQIGVAQRRQHLRLLLKSHQRLLLLLRCRECRVRHLLDRPALAGNAGVGYFVDSPIRPAEPRTIT